MWVRSYLSIDVGALLPGLERPQVVGVQIVLGKLPTMLIKFVEVRLVTVSLVSLLRALMALRRRRAGSTWGTGSG